MRAAPAARTRPAWSRSGSPATRTRDATPPRGGGVTHDAATRPGHIRVLLQFLLHVVLVACWVLVALMAVATWGPHVTRYKTEIIVGQSMEPNIPLWSLVVVEPVDPGDIKVGDVIVAQPAELDGRKVTHRVIEVGRTKDGRPEIHTKGDNNDT
ncbi:MAG: signal peptidase I, partial [Thermoleophilia bacterium]|nr:signal peptidase I [Thermoleophilia bacterium]